MTENTLVCIIEKNIMLYTCMATVVQLETELFICNILPMDTISIAHSSR